MFSHLARHAALGFALACPSALALPQLTLATTDGEADVPLPSGFGGPRAAYDADRVPTALDGLPLRFFENRGQWDLPQGFVGTCGPVRVHVEPSSMTVEVLAAPGEAAPPVTRFVFESASEGAFVEGAAPEAGRYNFFRGPGKGAEGLTPFGRVLQRSVYEGVDIQLRSAAGRLEYDVLLAPGADLSQVVVRCEGVEHLEVAADGRLLLHTEDGGVLEQSAPVTWAELENGERQPLECRYVLLEGTRYGYALPERAPAHPVVIDPGLEWSTLFGGTQREEIAAVRPAGQGRVLVAGSSDAFAWSLPGMGAPFGASAGTVDAFVALLDPAQSGASQVVWWTFLGGSANDFISDIEVNAAGEVFATGITASANFPTTPNAYDTTYNAAGDGYIARIDPTTGALLYSTFLGGFGQDIPMRLALTEPAEVTIAGITTAADFPTTATAFDATRDGSRDTFVSIFDLDQAGALSLVYSTYVGGAGDEGATGDGRRVGVDRRANGNIVVATNTDSVDWPVTLNALQPASAGLRDIVLAEIDPSVAGAAALVYGTYLGGSAGQGLNCCELDPSGRYVLAGYTYDGTFPVTNNCAFPFFNGPSGMNDGWIAVIDPSATNQLAYSTFVPGDGFEAVFGIEVGSDGTIFATGFSGADNIPTTNLGVTCGAYQTTFGGPRNDNWILALSPDGNGKDDIRYMSYLGGNGWEVGLDVSVESIAGTPVVLLSGATEAQNFPTTAGAAQAGIAGSQDGWVARLRLNPYGICVGNPNSVGPGARVCATGSVRLSDNALDLDVQGLPANSLGYFLMSTNPVAAFALPSPSSGALCLGGPQVRFRAFVLNSGNGGTVAFQPDLLNIPPPGAPLAPGDTAVFQYWYRDQGGGSNTSSGVAVTFE